MSQNMMTVSSLNTKIKSLLEATFMHTLVEGEVASVTYHTSGHLYFSIKDKESSLKCVMWRSAVSKMKFRIEKGMHIVVEGSVSVYTPRGEYQFQTVRIEPYGQGALALAYEQLKEKLKAKGYFDTHRKKSIPHYIQKLALVTAQDSAALHDMLKIIEKRWPMIEVSIVDTLVQGDGAAKQIAKSLRYADRLGVDVVVVSRGGGSAEDLWSFNEEAVADAIYHMSTPTVSAVGHEVDVMISDFVADLRAPTPSAAMEMILQDCAEVLYTLGELQERFSYVVAQRLQRNIQSLAHNEEMLLRASPVRLLTNVSLKFEDLKSEYHRVIDHVLNRFIQRIPEVTQAYSKNIRFVLQKKEQQHDFVFKNFSLNDPKNHCKLGWAQISVNHQKVELSELKLKETFVLQDAHTKIEALCIKKEMQ